MSRQTFTLIVVACVVIMLGGCHDFLIVGVDQDVHALISQRQTDALGERHDMNIGREDGVVHTAASMYSFVPQPVTAELPEPYRPGRTTPPESPVPEDAPAPPAPVTPMGLGDALAYATRHARDIQDAKEDLYLAALDLTLERHLWTPQFVASLSAEFADYGQIRDFDRAMSTVANVSVAQRLPYGGQVTARIINRLMRDLGRHTTSGETGTFIMDANIPLFRGAGRVAYESRYQAERELIYAVRAYERFRRQFVVNVATAYFSLQQDKASITNAVKSRDSLRTNTDRAELQYELRQQSIFDVARVRASLRSAESGVENAIERYESSLDQFKILLGMPVEQPLDIISQSDDQESGLLERLLPQVDKDFAVKVALAYRLDLLTVFDQIDDARRGVVISKNAILPDLDLSGSVTMNTDGNEFDSLGFNTERTTWRGLVELSVDDRKQERNAYRESLVGLRRRERGYEESADRVRADVRRALRRLQQAGTNRDIQKANVLENEARLAGAIAMNELDRSTNQDLVDAENDLLNARNAYSAAEAGYRTAILEFRLDTGTLRVTDEGSFPGVTDLGAPGNFDG